MTGGGRSTEGTELAGLLERLRNRHPQIVQSVYARIEEAVPTPVTGDPAYKAGVLEAISGALDYSLDRLELREESVATIPAAALEQARRAARAGVSLGEVVRRYVTGHPILGEFVMREAEHSGMSSNGQAMYDLRRIQEASLEELTAAVEGAYTEVADHGSRRVHHAHLVHGLLTGEVSDSTEIAELGYEIHGHWHVALTVSGPGAGAFIDRLPARGRSLLPVAINGHQAVWCSAACQADAEPDDLPSAGGRVTVGLGEPGLSLDGWRLSYEQARAAMRLAAYRPDRLARYAEDPLLAAALTNDTLVRTLKQRYLAPLSAQGDGGDLIRQTLRAYIEVEGNATCAMHKLNVSRRTVTKRVRRAEQLFGRSIGDCFAELDLALRLEALDPTTS